MTIKMRVFYFFCLLLSKYYFAAGTDEKFVKQFFVTVFRIRTYKNRSGQKHTDSDVAFKKMLLMI